MGWLIDSCQWPSIPILAITTPILPSTLELMTPWAVHSPFPCVGAIGVAVPALLEAGHETMARRR